MTISSSIAMILKSLFSSSSKISFFHGDFEFAPFSVENENGILTVEVLEKEMVGVEKEIDLSNIKEFHLIKCELWQCHSLDREELRVKNIVTENDNIKIFF